jgi:hypothetical protein
METLYIFSRQFDSRHPHGGLPDGRQLLPNRVMSELPVIHSESDLRQNQ